MQADPLSLIRSRLDRADEHLTALQVECARYADDRPYVPIIKDKADLEHILANWNSFDEVTRSNLEHRIFLIVAAEVKPVPTHLSLILADLIHNLRSALNNLAWHCVVVKSPLGRPLERPSKGFPATDFPIRDDPRADVKGSPVPLLYPFTTPAIEAFLDGLQPYQTGNVRGQTAALIRDLNNWDKHQTLKLFGAIIGGGPLTVRFPNGTISGRSAQLFIATTDGGQNVAEMRLEEGASLGYVEVIDGLRPYVAAGEVKVHSEMPAVVTLGEPGTMKTPSEPIQGVCSKLIDFVRNDIVGALTGLL